MHIFRRIFRVDPKFDLSKGQKAFNQRKYKLALKSFERAYNRFDTIEMKLISLDNAALSAEKASLFHKAGELYYRAILLKLHDNRQKKDIMQDVDRAIHTIQQSKKSSIPINKILFMKLLFYLSNKNFVKMNSFYKELKFELSDEYSSAIENTMELIKSADTFVKKATLPHVDLPEEFNSIKNQAEMIMQRCSLCTVLLKEVDQSELIQKGSEFSLTATLTAHAPVSIPSIKLRTGAKGRLTSSTLPELPLKLSTGENYSLIFSLTPNLTGEWEVGPVSITYSIPSELGEYSIVSNIVSIAVKDAPPALKLFMDFEIIEEDFEYLVRISAENVGKTALQDIKIITEIPEGVEIHEAPNEKYISTLGEGELFQYEIRIRFALNQTHFEGHIVRAAAYIEDGYRISKSSIKLGG